jgi:hypothetical protein
MDPPLVRFVLPLALCQPTNRTRGAPGYMLGKTKAALAEVMLEQWQAARRLIERDGGRVPALPLAGRPIVCASRFTSSATDAYADWAKAAIDTLCVLRLRPADMLKRKHPPRRLGIIVDDSPEAADVRQWCEPAPRGQGFVLVEVWG